MTNRDQASYDPARAIDRARTFANVTGVGCLVVNADGEILFKQLTGQEQCRFCHRLGELTGSHPVCGQVHLYGCYQAERFGGQYIYFCPTGMTHFASPITVGGQLMGGLVGGPLLIVDKEDYILHDVLEKNGLSSELYDEFHSLMSCFTTVSPEHVRYLSDTLAMSARDVSVYEQEHLRDVQEGQRQQQDISLAIHQLKRQQDTPYYPLNVERELMQALSEGDRETAHRLLNELLGHIYFSSGNRFDIIRTRVMELLVLLSRAAIDGGAESSQVFFLNERYLSEIGRFTSTEDLSLWLSRVLAHFLRFVFDLADIKHKDMMFKAVDYIKKRYTQKISLEEVSGVVYLSPSYFSKVFKDEMGCTFSVYLNKIRIDKSKLLLLSGQDAISDICDQVGFEDQSYFTKVFKKLTGMTPAKYRATRGLSADKRSARP